MIGELTLVTDELGDDFVAICRRAPHGDFLNELTIFSHQKSVTGPISLIFYSRLRIVVAYGKNQDSRKAVYKYVQFPKFGGSNESNSSNYPASVIR